MESTDRCSSIKRDGNKCSRLSTVDGKCKQHNRLIKIKEESIDMSENAIFITFGDNISPGHGFNYLGKMSEINIDRKELNYAKLYFQNIGCQCKIKKISVDNHDEAYILIIKNLSFRFDKLMTELLELKWDSLDKKKHNNSLCFAGFSQTANIEEKIPTVISFDNLPFLSSLQSHFINSIRYDNIVADANYFPDKENHKSTFQGHLKRKILMGAFLGGDMPFHFQQFYNGKALDKPKTIKLHDGDLFIVTSNAIGCDWRKKSVNGSFRHGIGNVNNHYF